MLGTLALCIFSKLLEHVFLVYVDRCLMWNTGCLSYIKCPIYTHSRFLNTLYCLNISKDHRTKHNLIWNPNNHQGSHTRYYIDYHEHLIIIVT